MRVCVIDIQLVCQMQNKKYMSTHPTHPSSPPKKVTAIFKNIQLHRVSCPHIIYTGRNFQQLSRPTFCSKHGHSDLSLVHSSFVQSPRMEMSQPPWTTFLPCLTAPTGKVFFLVSNQNASCSNLCLLPLILCFSCCHYAISKKSLALCSLHTPIS